MLADRRRARVGLAAAARGSRRSRSPSVGPGEVLGEIPLLDGGRHSATARVTEPASLLSLGRADFAALVSRRHPTAFALKRRIARIACARLRRQLANLARVARRRRRAEAPARRRTRVLRTAGQPVRAAARELPRLRLTRAVGVPDRRPLRPLPAAPHAGRRGSRLAGLLPDDQRRGREGHRPRRPPHPRRARGSRAGVRVREPDRRRAVAGDATTRERTLLLVLPQAAFERLFNGERAGVARVPRRDPPRPDGGRCGRRSARTPAWPSSL